MQHRASIAMGAFIGRFNRKDIALLNLQVQTLHILEKRIATKTEVCRFRMTGDKTDPRKTKLLEARQNLEDGVLIVHVDEIGFNDLIKGIDEDCGQAEPLYHVDICRRKLGPKRDHTAHWRTGKRFRYYTYRLPVETYHFQRIVSARRFRGHAVNIIRDKNTVIAVDRLAMLGNLEKADRLPGAWRSF